MVSQRDSAMELHDALNRLRRSRFFSHAGHLKNAEKHVLFKIAKLNNGQPVTPSELAGKLNVSLSAITHQINSLEKQCLIKRIHNQDDRRVVAIALSKKGEGEVKQLQKEFIKKINILTDYLGEHDTADLVRIMKKISTLAESRSENAKTL